jgi:hypothetical protein
LGRSSCWRRIHNTDFFTATAARSGVSWSSLKRFEYTGLIALDSLLKLALVLAASGISTGLCARTTGIESGIEVARRASVRNRSRAGKGRIK